MLNKENIDKLNFHIQAFQEGFNILISSKTKSDLEINFSRIVKGNLLVKQTRLYYTNGNSNWEQVFPIIKNTNSVNFPEVNEIKLIKNFPKLNEHSSLIPFNEKEVYALVISEKLNGKDFDEEDYLNLKLFSQLLLSGYQSFNRIKNEKELIFSLNNRIMQLNTLIDTGIELSLLNNVSKLISLSLERAVSITNSSKGIVKIFRKEIFQESVYFPSEFDFKLDKFSDNFVINSVIDHQDIKIEFFLLEKESRRGTVPFDATDKLLADAITKQVAAALQNDYLLHQLIDKQKIEKELELASEIQKIIIPTKLPEIEGYKMAGINIPSKEVGGDYYDVIQLKDGRFALVVADVTGKGFPAALLVSTLNAALSAYIDLEIPITELAAKLNSIIYKSSTRDKFITFFIAILSPESGQLEILNAGHNPSLLLQSDGKLVKLDAGGLPFGMFDMGQIYESQTISLNKGERLLLFSDGIPEAMNENSEEFSDEKLEEIFLKFTPDNPEEFIAKILVEVKKHSGTAPQSDDITSLYLLRY